MEKYYKLRNNTIVDKNSEIIGRGIVFHYSPKFKGHVIGNTSYYAELPKGSVEITKEEYNKRCVKILDGALAKDIDRNMKEIEKYQKTYEAQVNKLIK